MATSGTYTAISSMTVAQIVDESFRRCKIAPEDLTSEHAMVARLSLNLMFIDWINDGVQQFITDEETESLAGDGTDISFTCPAGTIDVLDMIFRDASENDIQIAPVSRKDYLYINNKETTGQPITYFVDKSALPPTVYLWPVQNITGTSVVYNRLRQVQDVGASTNTVDTTVTYVEAMCACLAAKLAEKYSDPATETALLQKAAVVYKRAKDQDRDRAPYVMKPRLGRRR